MTARRWILNTTGTELNVEKEDMEMKVVNVDFVENEMVELDVVQIGLN